MEEGKEKRIRRYMYGITVALDVMTKETLRNPVSLWLRSWFPAMVKLRAFVWNKELAVSQNSPSTLGRPMPTDGWL